MGVKSDLPRERNCNSWVVVRRDTGKAVMETWSEIVAAGINLARYEVVTAAEWLRRVNFKAKAAA